MKVTLIYEGNLWQTGNKSGHTSEKKWEVRAQIDPQLRQLWKEHYELTQIREYSWVPKNGRGIWTIPHPQYPDVPQESLDCRFPLPEYMIDVCEPVPHSGGRTFFPLVRRSLGLTCGLKILFLRNEPKGNLFNQQSGDLDNRIKTLVDGLSIPRPGDNWVCENPALSDPVYCLLENDDLVTAFDVRTEQLLSPKGTHDKEVRLVIEVDVRVTHPRMFNMFLGGE